jgi:hypothetical protein
MWSCAEFPRIDRKLLCRFGKRGIALQAVTSQTQSFNKHRAAGGLPNLHRRAVAVPSYAELGLSLRVPDFFGSG